MIPREAKPHEVAILRLMLNGYNSKQIASELHYKQVQPVNRVLRKWRKEQ